MTYSLLHDYESSLSLISFQSNEHGRVKDLSEFIRSNSHTLRVDPESLFQLAINQPDCSEVHKIAYKVLSKNKIEDPWLGWVNKPQVRTPVAQVLTGHKEAVSSCCFSPDGKRIASASSDETINIWDAKYGNMLMTLRGHESYVNSCTFSPDGSRLASSSGDESIRIWDAKHGKLLMTLKGHSGDVNSCAFSPDGKLIVSASSDSTLIIWDSSTGRKIAILTGHSDHVNACSFSPDGKYISGSSGKRVLVRNE